MDRLFHDYQNTSYIGVGLRCGGRLGDNPDLTMHLSTQQIRNALTKLQKTQGPFFLSTVSRYVKDTIKKSIPLDRIHMNNEKVMIVDTQLVNSEQTVRKLLLSVAELMLWGKSQQCYGIVMITFTLVGCAMAQKNPYLVGVQYSSYVTMTSFM